jgi:nitric oxide dioxygenase
MLTTEHIAVVKSTIPLLDAGGPAITEYFYQRLFNHNPELKDIFNMSNQKTGRQKTALFEAILAYAKNIDNLAVLKHAVERIAQKHTSFHIKPAHYQIVGLHLIETLRELLPEQFTPQVESAWTAAYGVLANIFINREEQLYRERENNHGGWRGKRAFCLVDKKIESALVTSFVFEPMDHQSVIDYQVGQYIGIELTPEHSKNIEIRQYSLSDKPNGKSFRISVKRELGEHNGLMSNHLHANLNVGDLVDLHSPATSFLLIAVHPLRWCLLAWVLHLCKQC